MSVIALTDFTRASDEWRSYTSPTESREFFLRIARSIIHLWKRREFNALEEHLKGLTRFAELIPELSADQQVRAYAGGAVDILIEQGVELLNSSSSSTERVMSGDLANRHGKNHARVIASLYDRPLKLTAISKEVRLDRSYTCRILQDLERSDIVQELGGGGYALTSAGIDAYSRIAEPGWTHKARRFLVVMLESLDAVGTFSRRLLCQKVRDELNVPLEVADRLVARSLSELETQGRLSITDDSVALKATPFAIAKAFEEIQASPARIPQPAALQRSLL